MAAPHCHAAAPIALAMSMASCSGVDETLNRYLTATCDDLPSFHDATLGCIDIPRAPLGELFAVFIDGSRPPVSLGVHAVTEPPSYDELAMATAACVDVLVMPVLQSPGVGLSRSYRLPAFKADTSLDLGAATTEVQLRVGDEGVNLDVGTLTLLTLRDPVRLLNCSRQVVDAIGRYWSSLSPQDRSQVAFYLVDQVATTASLNLSSENGESLSTTVSKFQLLDLSYSVSYDCSAITGLPNDGAPTAVFIDGYPNAMSFDGTTFSVSNHAVACNAVLGAAAR